MKLLTIIPARGGSKGIPGKNRLPVHGKPLIAWTIECALRTEGLGRIVVSTDDAEILTIAQGYKGVVALHRPAHLAEDKTPIVEVIEHLLAQEAAAGQGPYEAILLLQPTAPIREPRHIHGALQALKPDVNAVISVVAMQDMHPARMYQMGDDLLLQPMIPALELTRRQDIPPAYCRNGSIYLVRAEGFRGQRSVMAKPAAGYEMEARLLLNIDEPRDMLIAAPLIAAWQDGRL
jgi:CMP-N-acetylneuraminic acid synthetase